MSKDKLEELRELDTTLGCVQDFSRLTYLITNYASSVELVGFDKDKFLEFLKDTKENLHAYSVELFKARGVVLPEITKEVLEMNLNHLGNIGNALLSVTDGGRKIRRESWPKGDFVVRQKAYPNGIPCNKQTAEAYGLNEGELFKCAPYLQKMEGGVAIMWTPDQKDLFANDWEVLI
ncbi:hypothetical protein [Bacillus phage YungSlug]|nr:hypothetical protein [Bacillus phage YungSlug]